MSQILGTIKITRSPREIAGPGSVRHWWQGCVLPYHLIDSQGRAVVPSKEALAILAAQSMTAENWYRQRGFGLPDEKLLFQKGDYEIVKEPVAA